MTLVRAPGGVVVARRPGGLLAYINDPVATLSFPLAFLFNETRLVKRIRGTTDTGTFDFQIERRDEESELSTGTELMSGNLQATSSGVNVSTFAVARVSRRSWVWFVAKAVSSATEATVLIDWR